MMKFWSPIVLFSATLVLGNVYGQDARHQMSAVDQPRTDHPRSFRAILKRGQIVLLREGSLFILQQSKHPVNEASDGQTKSSASRIKPDQATYEIEFVGSDYVSLKNSRQVVYLRLSKIDTIVDRRRPREPTTVESKPAEANPYDALLSSLQQKQNGAVEVKKRIEIVSQQIARENVMLKKMQVELDRNDRDILKQRNSIAALRDLLREKDDDVISYQGRDYPCADFVEGLNKRQNVLDLRSDYQQSAIESREERDKKVLLLLKTLKQLENDLQQIEREILDLEVELLGMTIQKNWGKSGK